MDAFDVFGVGSASFLLACWVANIIAALIISFSVTGEIRGLSRRLAAFSVITVIAGGLFIAWYTAETFSEASGATEFWSDRQRVAVLTGLIFEFLGTFLITPFEAWFERVTARSIFKGRRRTTIVCTVLSFFCQLVSASLIVLGIAISVFVTVDVSADPIFVSEASGIVPLDSITQADAIVKPYDGPVPLSELPLPANYTAPTTAPAFVIGAFDADRNIDWVYLIRCVDCVRVSPHPDASTAFWNSLCAIPAFIVWYSLIRFLSVANFCCLGRRKYTIYAMCAMALVGLGPIIWYTESIARYGANTEVMQVWATCFLLSVPTILWYSYSPIHKRTANVFELDPTLTADIHYMAASEVKLLGRKRLSLAVSSLPSAKDGR